MIRKVFFVRSVSPGLVKIVLNRLDFVSFEKCTKNDRIVSEIHCLAWMRDRIASVSLSRIKPKKSNSSTDSLSKSWLMRPSWSFLINWACWTRKLSYNQINLNGIYNSVLIQFIWSHLKLDNRLCFSSLEFDERGYVIRFSLDFNGPVPYSVNKLVFWRTSWWKHLTIVRC